MDISVDEVLRRSREDKISFVEAIINDSEGIVADPLPALKVLLKDKDETVRKLAVTAAWDYPDVDIIDVLFDIVYHDRSKDVRAKAVVTLGRFIYEGTIADYNYPWVALEEDPLKEESLPEKDFLRVKQFLLELFRDERQPLDVRRFAVESLSFLVAPDVITLIREAYEHPDPNMKVSAIFAMGRNGNEAWANILLKELNSPVPEIQFEATRASGEFGLQEAAPLLMDLAESENKDLALEAIWSLGRTGGTGVRPFLEDYTESEDPDVVEVAEAALDELGLTELIDDLEDTVRPPNKYEDDDYEDFLADDEEDDE